MTEGEVAALLRRSLVRFHPSFRFEESLAAGLRAEAEALLGIAPAGTDGDPHAGQLIVFPRPPLAPAVAPAAAPVAPRGRGLLVGGAIASGLSLAGAAWLAWRRGHRVAS